MSGMTLRTRSAASAAAAVVLLALSACGGEPTSSATSAATAAPATSATAGPAATPAAGPTADLTRVAAVASRIFPAGPARDCSAGGFDACPFTARLKTRMQAIAGATTGGGADPVCRCQNSYTSVAVTTALVSGQPVAHVDLGFGPQASVKMDWLFVEASGAWLADDSYCTAQGPSTSIYGAMRPCSG
jgi:hypothetical protein